MDLRFSLKESLNNKNILHKFKNSEPRSQFKPLKPLNQHLVIAFTIPKIFLSMYKLKNIKPYTICFLIFCQEERSDYTKK